MKNRKGEQLTAKLEREVEKALSLMPEVRPNYVKRFAFNSSEGVQPNIFLSQIFKK